jgi:hypothetical protein
VTTVADIFPLLSSLVVRFIPLAQETFGGWSGMASHQICLIADLQADRTGAPRFLCRNALFCALSVVTLRSIARDMIDRFGRLPEYAPLLPHCPSLRPSPCALLSKIYAFCAFARIQTNVHPAQTEQKQKVWSVSCDQLRTSKCKTKNSNEIW